MKWAEVQTGDVLHWEGDEAHSYVVIGEVVFARHDRMILPVLDLDRGEAHYDHQKDPNVEIEYPWRLERGSRS